MSILRRNLVGEIYLLRVRIFCGAKLFSIQHKVGFLRATAFVAVGKVAVSTAAAEPVQNRN